MAKNYSQMFHSVIEILLEALKLPTRNKTIFIFIILSTVISYTLLVIANILSLASLSSTLSMNVFPLLNMDPKCPEYPKQLLKLKEDIILILLVETIYMLLMTMASLLSLVSTVYMSAMSYLGKDLTLKELLSKIKQNWFRPLITWFLNFLISVISLIFLYLPPLFLMVFARESILIVAVAVVLILIDAGINLYLILVCTMSIVVSVLEDCYGLRALGKAQKLIKERKATGLVLCFVLVVPFNVLCLAVALTNNQRTIAVQLLISWTETILAVFVSALSMMAYTVFYFDCKQSNGELVDFEDDTQYSKLSTVSDDGLALP